MQKLLAVCVVFGVAAIGLAKPGRGGQQRFQEFLSRPICQCDAIDLCVGEKEAKKDACKNEPVCTAFLDAAGVEVSAVQQCCEQGKQAHEDFKQCMEAELGKLCDDGSGTISEPELPTGGRRGHRGGHRGRGGRRGGHKGRGGKHGGLIPEPLKNYKKCVHQCVKGEPEEGARVKRGGHKGKGVHMECMKELECRPVMHTREAKQAAMETCKANFDHAAKFTQMCECLKGAGFGDMDCSAVPTGRSRQQRQLDDDSDEEDSDESLEDEDDDEQ